jgi:hypothetical protein
VFSFLRRSRNDADTFVQSWKKAWIAGAQARWKNGAEPNPYPADPARAAWNAGHAWAADNPDRRTNNHGRLAHPRRRATDPATRIVRTIELGALSLGAVAAARWIWRRRKRQSL